MTKHLATEDTLTLNKHKQIHQFLSECGWSGAIRTAIAGDASFRRYERITLGQSTAILMDAPPDKEDVKPFLQVAEYLSSLNLRAPKILAQDIARGFLLLEDLGDDLYSAVLAKTPKERLSEHELSLYKNAVDVLISLFQTSQKNPPPALPPYDDAVYMREISLFNDWYLPAIFGAVRAHELAPSFVGVWKQCLSALPNLPSVPALRDFHADNLLVLNATKGAQAVGLLDFQDALIGSPAYDLVSFLEDARRDVSAETVIQCKAHFSKHTGIDSESFETAYHILGAQRNCKIIGIFTRLGIRDGKLRYQQYLPRVWQHLNRDITHPALAPLANWLSANILEEWRSGKAPIRENI